MVALNVNAARAALRKSNIGPELRLHCRGGCAVVCLLSNFHCKELPTRTWGDNYLHIIDAYLLSMSKGLVALLGDCRGCDGCKRRQREVTLE